MFGDVELVIDQPALDAFLKGDEIRDGLIAEAEPVVAASQAAAPKLTGGGAGSIHAEVEDAGELSVRISWDRAHYYMVFHQVGTRYLPARPFLGAGYVN